jgi:hypothetical protein
METFLNPRQGSTCSGRSGTYHTPDGLGIGKKGKADPTTLQNDDTLGFLKITACTDPCHTKKIQEIKGLGEGSGTIVVHMIIGQGYQVKTSPGQAKECGWVSPEAYIFRLARKWRAKP